MTSKQIIPGEVLERKSVRLSQVEIAFLEDRGDGNMSAGFRAILGRSMRSAAKKKRISAIMSRRGRA